MISVQAVFRHRTRDIANRVGGTAEQYMQAHIVDQLKPRHIHRVLARLLELRPQ